MTTPYPETELQGEPVNDSSLNVECDFCPGEAMMLADGLPVCADHGETLRTGAVLREAE